MTNWDELVPTDTTIAQIVDDVTSAMLGATTALAPTGELAPGAWSGHVRVGDVHPLVVALHCSRRLATRAGRSMLGGDDPTPADEAAREALAELANVVGAHVKGLVAPLADAPVGVPEVETTTTSLDGARTLRRVLLRCDDELLRVDVYLLDGVRG